MQAGFQVHMTKPIDVPAFLSTVGRLAGTKRHPVTR
jgi:hypothetical protein